MADDIRDDRPSGSTPASVRGEEPGSTMPWPLIIAALLLGLLLGAGITWAATHDGGDAGAPQAEPTATSTTEPLPTPSTVTQTVNQVAVPQSCLQIAEESRKLNDALAKGVVAARDLDASAMSGIVRDFGAQQERIQQLAEQCRTSAETPKVVTTTG
ncbi:hypothetical protein [Mobilicoccus sp.]|uniref:hypothetical protein n=1 Tax=Mobilicoccus sp. TaxID=2034349 RepID=UPI00289CAE3F|nr:hypothetical protein [Mobilicoccus sp.]